MESRTMVLGHSLHQMLIVFPLGLLGTAVIFDIVHLATGAALWATISFWMIVSGLIGALAAAPPGAIDWAAIPSGTRAKAIGSLHGIGNLVVVALFAVSLYLRWNNPSVPGTAALVLSFCGVALAVATAWLGGELVARLGVGVDTGAHLNAPSSLSNRPASASETGAAPTGPAPAHG